MSRSRSPPDGRGPRGGGGGGAGLNEHELLPDRWTRPPSRGGSPNSGNNNMRTNSSSSSGDDIINDVHGGDDNRSLSSVDLEHQHQHQQPTSSRSNTSGGSGGGGRRGMTTQMSEGRLALANSIRHHERMLHQGVGGGPAGSGGGGNHGGGGIMQLCDLSETGISNAEAPIIIRGGRHSYDDLASESPSGSGGFFDRMGSARNLASGGGGSSRNLTTTKIQDALAEDSTGSGGRDGSPDSRDSAASASGGAVSDWMKSYWNNLDKEEGGGGSWRSTVLGSSRASSHSSRQPPPASLSRAGQSFRQYVGSSKPSSEERSATGGKRFFFDRVHSLSSLSTSPEMASRRRICRMASLVVLVGCVGTMVIYGSVTAVNHKKGQQEETVSNYLMDTKGDSSIRAASDTPKILGGDGKYIPPDNGMNRVVPQEPYQDVQHADVVLPPFLEENLAPLERLPDDVSGDERLRDGTTPLFFMPPSSGDMVMKKVTRQCIGLVEASDAGTEFPQGDLEVYEAPPDSGIHYVNVDTTTVPGLDRARQVNLVNTGLAQIYYSPLFFDMADVFTNDRQGRCIALFRHPVERTVHDFIMTSQRASMSQVGEGGQQQQTPAYSELEWHAVSGQLDDNLVIRMILDKSATDPISEYDFKLATELLRRKCLVGLSDYTHMKQSLLRFGQYLGWHHLHDMSKWDQELDPQSGVTGKDHRDACLDRMIAWGQHQIPRDFVVEEGSKLWELIMGANEWDMRLYDYVSNVLFVEQAALV